MNPDSSCELFPWDIKPASVEDILQAEVKRGRLKIEVKPI
jgi:hypothetical protein